MSLLALRMRMRPSTTAILSSSSSSPLLSTTTTALPLSAHQLRFKSSSTANANADSASAPSNRFPEMFDQTVVLSNGATFTLRTPSPRAQIRLTRDTRNHPLWNPELRGQSTGDESGQLSKFAKKFGDDLDDLLDLDFADGGDVDRKALTAKQIAQATPQKPTGKKRK
ncbi:hypothetical protein DFQ26_007691 [Actinomortierella ambigua]|nr:hypothetical protein DFQ26_007691 [Actinomortierella ambigua]